MTVKPVQMPEGYEIFDPVDPFENNAGPFYYRSDTTDGILFAMIAEKRHCNSHGIVHGGLMMTMADLTMVVTARWGTDIRQFVTVSMNTDFVNAGQLGDMIYCRAELVRRTGSLAFVSARVFTDENVLLSCNAVVKRIRNE